MFDFMEDYSYAQMVGALVGKLDERDREVCELFRCKDTKRIEERIECLKQRILPILEDGELCHGNFEAIPCGIVHKETWRIEKYRLEKDRLIFATVNVYCPNDESKKHPGLLVLTGHWAGGKSIKDNRIMCANFAMNGVVTAVFDPIYQGERRVLSEKESERQFPGLPEDLRMVSAHDLAGNMAYALEKNLMSCFMRDARAVLDFLCAREDVDTSRIGCVGQSGGGTQAIFLAACDVRIRYYSPIQCMSKLQEILKVGIGDSEQSIDGSSAKEAFDVADQAWLAFPKPMLLSMSTEDQFSYSGAQKIAQELEELYQICDHASDFEMVVVPGGHENGPESRKAEYEFFLRRMGLSYCGTEIQVDLEENELLCGIDGRLCHPQEEYRRCIRSAKEKRPENDAEKLNELRMLLKSKLAIPFASCISRLEQRGLKDTEELLVRIGDIYCEPYEQEAVLDLIPFGHAGQKTSAGYDIHTCIAYASWVLGYDICAEKIREINENLTRICWIYGYKKVRVVAAESCIYSAAVAVAVHDGAYSVILQTIPEDYETVFLKDVYLIDETEILKGLLYICDMADLKRMIDKRWT